MCDEFKYMIVNIWANHNMIKYQEHFLPVMIVLQFFCLFFFGGLKVLNQFNFYFLLFEKFSAWISSKENKQTKKNYHCVKMFKDRKKSTFLTAATFYLALELNT